MADYKKMTRADLRAFDDNGTRLVLEMTEHGWTGRWTSANKLRLVSPDGAAHLSLPVGLNGRRLENYARPYRRWKARLDEETQKISAAVDPMYEGFHPDAVMLAQIAGQAGWNVRLLVNGKIEVARGKGRFLLPKGEIDKTLRKQAAAALAKHSDHSQYERIIERLVNLESTDSADDFIEAFDLSNPRVKDTAVTVAEKPNTEPKPYRRKEPITAPDGVVRAIAVKENHKVVGYECAHEGCGYTNTLLPPVAVHFARSKDHPKPPKRQPETKPEFVPEKVTVTELDGPVLPEAPGVILDQVRALVAPQMQEQIETLTRERDEARAALARVREDLAGVRELMGSIGKEENK